MKSGSITLAGEDQSVVRTALDLLDKAITTADKACNKIGVPTVDIARLRVMEKEARQALDSAVEKPEWDIPPTSGYALRIGIKIMVEQLEKTKEAQLDLGVTPDDTEARLQGCEAVMAKVRGEGALAFSGR